MEDKFPLKAYMGRGAIVKDSYRGRTEYIVTGRTEKTHEVTVRPTIETDLVGYLLCWAFGDRKKMINRVWPVKTTPGYFDR
ncbi:MAG: hypothetical protein AAB573_00825 [Patescibacteria group bacterium]